MTERGTAPEDDQRSVTVRDPRRDGRSTLRWIGGALLAKLLTDIASSGQILPFIAAVLGALGAVLYAELRDSRPTSWRIDASGLHERWFGGRRVTHPWSSVRGIAEHPGEFVVRTDSGPVTMPGDRANSEVLLQWLHESAAQPRPDETISPEAIAGWLGIALDGELVTPPDHSLLPMLLSLSVLIGCTAVAFGVMFGPGFAIPLLLLLAGLLVYSQTDRLTDVRVTPYGFYHGRRLVGCWADIGGSLQGQHGNELHLLGGHYVLSYTQRAPVANAITQILQARREGLEVARLDGVPNTALSRAEHQEVSAELGLSRTGEE